MLRQAHIMRIDSRAIAQTFFPAPGPQIPGDSPDPHPRPPQGSRRQPQGPLEEHRFTYVSRH